MSWLPKCTSSNFLGHVRDGRTFCPALSFSQHSALSTRLEPSALLEPFGAETAERDGTAGIHLDPAILEQLRRHLATVRGGIRQFLTDRVAEHIAVPVRGVPLEDAAANAVLCR